MKKLLIVSIFIYSCSNTSYSDKVAKECKAKEDSLKRVKNALDNEIKIMEAKNR